MIESPVEVVRHILEYNADFHPNLLKCHAELLGIDLGITSE